MTCTAGIKPFSSSRHPPRITNSPQVATVVNKTCRVRLLSVNNAGGCHSVGTSLGGCRRDGDASAAFVIAVADSQTAH